MYMFYVHFSVYLSVYVNLRNCEVADKKSNAMKTYASTQKCSHMSHISMSDAKLNGWRMLEGYSHFLYGLICESM